MSDDPISSKDEDDLGRAPFAAEIAKRLADVRLDRSTIVGIVGDWGSGKTSLMRMVLEHLKMVSPDAIEVCEFNPWQWSGQDQLASALFDTVGRGVLSKPRNGNSIPSHIQSKRLANKFRRYAAALGVGGAITGALSSFVRGLVTLGLAGGAVALFFWTGWLPSATSLILMWALGLVSLAVSFGGKSLSLVAGYYDAKSVEEDVGAIELKSDLSTALREKKARVFVVIDDIDRLVDAEIRLLFQMLKVNLDLPGVVYVLLFQQSTVESALGNDNEGRRESGRRYLEKIVPVRYDVPPISREYLRKMVLAELKQMSGEVAGLSADEARWLGIYMFGIRDYVRTLRDAKRLIGSLWFHIGGYRADGRFEVDFVDAAALESLRVFEPDLYGRLHRSRDLLLGTIGPGGDRQSFAELLNASSVVNRHAAEQVLFELFPQALGAPRSIPTAELLRRRGVGHERMFDLYFGMASEGGSIRIEDVENVIASTATAGGYKETLLGMVRNGRYDAFVDIMTSHLLDIPHDNIPQFVSGVLTSVDYFEDAFDFYQFAESLIEKRVGLIRDARARSEIIENGLKGCESVFAVVAFVSRQPNKSGEKVLDDDGMTRMQEFALSIIRGTASSGALARSAGLWHILLMWEQWGASEEVQAWVNSVISRRDGVFAFLGGLVNSSAVIGGKGPYKRYYISKNLVAKFVPLSTLDEKIMVMHDLSDNEKRLAEMYLRKSDDFGG